MKMEKAIFEDFFKLQILIFRVVGFYFIPSETATVRSKIINKLMKIQFWMCLTNIFVFIATFYIRLKFEIRNLKKIVKILPNATNIPYNITKCELKIMKEKNVFTKKK